MNKEDRKKIQEGFKKGVFERLTGWNDVGHHVWLDNEFGLWSVEGEGKDGVMKAFRRFDAALNLFLKQTTTDNIDICFTDDVDLYSKQSYMIGCDNFINIVDLDDIDLDDIPMKEVA